MEYCAMNTDKLTLRLPADKPYLHVVTSFVKTVAVSFGFDRMQSMAVTLATEEIFTHVAHFTPPDVELEIICRRGTYYIEVEFDFTAESLDLKAFNLTSSLNPDDPDSIDQMGLFLASRSVDRFDFSRGPGDKVILTLIKENTYPEADSSNCAEIGNLSEFNIHEPDENETALFAELVNAHYSAHDFPEFFRYPGKIAAMARGEECHVLTAMGPTGTIGGGLAWRWLSPRTVECYGPYLFNQDIGSPMAEALLEACLQKLARTSCVGLIAPFAGDSVPTGYFQQLGDRTIKNGLGDTKTCTTWFRLLAEDMGSLVWSHPDLVGFLEAEYQRLTLPREIQKATNIGRADPYSVLAAQINRFNKEVQLRPILSGRDIEDNLTDHLRLLNQERVETVYFTIDLGRGWQAEFVPHLLAQGFRPCMVVPYAGKADQVILRLENNQS
jgi:anti-sigma regulatory factor (Ser/Thr protein kinase)